MSASNESPQSKRSLFQLITELPHLFGQLVRAEIELLRREVLHRLKGTGIGLGLMVLALSLVSIFVTLLVVAGILALSLVLAPWLAVLILAGVVLVVALIVLAIGAKLLSGTTTPVPERTLANVREDVERIRGDKPSKKKAHRDGA